ncbi:MAG TPA: glycoside hydrolase family 15 protein, partial [Cyclobacteriaceae bacterium]|nr:glycoside hydrolase family 15 protein [Cyclobacteriaceae bacterium]
MVEISQLGIIGNCRSAALITNTGSIVWCCLPDFDSPSAFAKILDERKGGELSIIAEDHKDIFQSYVDRTNILRTVFETATGAFEVLDFMPYYHVDERTYFQPPEIYRLIRVLSGKPRIKIIYNPRLNYARGATRSIINREYIKSFTTSGDYHSVYLYSSLRFSDILEGNSVTLVNYEFLTVSYHQKLISLDIDRVILEMERTKVYWMNWINRTRDHAMYQKDIVRSALTLKLLTYQKTGAVIAAVTTSIPESIGETRNWDYRYCWLRDASMIIQTLREISHDNTAREFLRFLLNTMIHKADTLQILYGIRGEKELDEKKLTHLSGYKNSKPVRIGNAAYLQKQNDIYGVLMDLIYTGYRYYPTSLNESEELWTTVRFIMQTVAHSWHKPDRGIWEIRKARKHFVFSKVLSWVAADRGVKIAEMLGRHEFITPWKNLRDQIRSDIEKNGWNKSRKAYTQFYGSKTLDASLLLQEKVGYCRADDPRYVSTVRAIYKNLCRDGLMYRYRNKDDFGTPKSAFIICTFWMIDSLYKIGEKKIAL